MVEFGIHKVYSRCECVCVAVCELVGWLVGVYVEIHCVCMYIFVHYLLARKKWNVVECRLFDFKVTCMIIVRFDRVFGRRNSNLSTNSVQKRTKRERRIPSFRRHFNKWFNLQYVLNVIDVSTFVYSSC